MSQEQKTKVSKAASNGASTTPVRLKQATHKKLQKILDAVNKKEYGRKIRPDAVIDAALALIGVEQIEHLRTSSMTNADRLDKLYRAHVAKEKFISKDDFIGLVLSGRVNELGEGATSREPPRVVAPAS